MLMIANECDWSISRCQGVHTVGQGGDQEEDDGRRRRFFLNMYFPILSFACNFLLYSPCGH